MGGLYRSMQELEVGAEHASSSVFCEFTVLPGGSNGPNLPIKSLRSVMLLPQSTADIMRRTLDSRD
jgi:hypothetical protein